MNVLYTLPVHILTLLSITDNSALLVSTEQLDTFLLAIIIKGVASIMGGPVWGAETSRPM